MKSKLNSSRKPEEDVMIAEYRVRNYTKNERAVLKSEPYLVTNEFGGLRDEKKTKSKIEDSRTLWLNRTTRKTVFKVM